MAQTAPSLRCLSLTTRQVKPRNPLPERNRAGFDVWRTDVVHRRCYKITLSPRLGPLVYP
jgi:hypothetical protein